MSFTKVDTDGHSIKLYSYKVRRLFDELPPEEGEALREIMANPNIPYSHVRQIIREQADSFPEMDSQLFHLAPDTVRRHCVEMRALNGREVRGL